MVDYLGYPERVFPVGRLDKDSEGLLLLTSDGEIVNRLLRAAGHHEKEYEVEVDRPLTNEFMQRMMHGVPILDTDPALPSAAHGGALLPDCAGPGAQPADSPHVRGTGL